MLLVCAAVNAAAAICLATGRIAADPSMEAILFGCLGMVCVLDAMKRKEIGSAPEDNG